MEGPVLLVEAVQAGFTVVEQYVRDDYDEYIAPSVQTFELEARTFQSVSDTESPRGVLAVCEMPGEPRVDLGVTDWVLVADEVSDPGNLGTLIRSAEAAGVSAVILSGSTVDPWSPKVVRASAGAVFHVPLLHDESLHSVRQRGVRLLGTTSHEAIGSALPTSMYECDVSGTVGVVVGNEAHGLPTDAPVDEWITIPHVGRSESLNVAMAGTVALMHVAHVRKNAGAK